jgi:hypothetical protein
MIEPECIIAIYEKAKGIYSGKDTLKNAKSKLYSEYGVNENSFADYYLTRIYEDYGVDKLRIALQMYNKSILYYEQCHNNRLLKKDRRIYDKHLKTLNKNY